jgi:pimeloyl-ACP methyl ester carboxylesterase
MAETKVQPWETRIEGAPALAVRVREGRGSPVVLLHGWGRTLEDWEPVGALLARDHAVYAVDLRGHGLSADAASSLDGHVDDLIRVIGHFGLERPVLAGYGLGGAVALACATRRSGLAGVVAIEAHGRPRGAELAERLGVSPCAAEDLAAAAHRFAVAQALARTEPVPLDAFERRLAELRGGPCGAPGDVLAASALRSVRMGDGVVAPRPGPRAVRALDAAFDEYRPSCVHDRLLAPAVELVSTAPAPVPPGAPERYADVLAARTAAELAAEAPLLTVRPVEGGHPHLTAPALVADLVHAAASA